MRTVAVVAAVLAFAAVAVVAVDVCLPNRHTAWISTHVYSSREGRSEMHVRTYHDKESLKSRQEFFPRRHATHTEISGFVLRDYQLGKEWRGMIVNKTVHDCGLFNIEGDRDGSPYCPVKDGKKIMDAKLGQNFKVEIINFRHPHEKGFYLDTEVAVEHSRLDAPVLRNSVADFQNQEANFFHHEREEFWDIDVSPIDPIIFTVPRECPM